MKKILWLIPLLLALHFGRLVSDAGAFRTIRKHGMEGCKSRGAITGAEDMEWARGLNLVFVSSDHRPENGEATPSGAIYAFSPSDQAPPIKVTGALPFSFHPHGLGLWEGGGQTHLFAVNHRPGEDTVESFLWEKGALRHEATFRNPLLTTGNDILATGANSFYVTLDHGSPSHLAQQAEHFTRIGRGSLIYFNGQNFSAVATGLFFANGLAEDPTLHRLYVAEMLGKRVRVYDDSQLGKPAYLRTIALSSAPDNLKVDPLGNIWAGTHPKLFALKKHSEHHAELAPTLILRVGQAEGAAPAEEIFADDGSMLKASSVALPLGDKVFLGSIYDEKILECPLP